MKLLDLFCGAGGAAMSYHRAGFDEIVGVDIKPQKRYPFEFILGDALEYVSAHGMEFDAIHASPPCQAYSIASVIHRNNGKEYPKLIEPTRAALIRTRRLYVIENVPGAPLLNPLMLCGLMFDLCVFRHRNFETSFYCFVPDHPSHTGKRIGEGYFSVAGSAGRWKTWGTVQRNVSKGTADEWRAAMGIDWMTRKELTQAIPPAYTEYIGRQLLEVLHHEVNQ
jgi:DNA (cytosine-5)-methyltransferase 1